MGNEVVCVTGGSGYIASWLVRFLLENGYTVKATVRNLSNPKKVEHLKAFAGANERLHLFEANLIHEGCFDSIVDGCECVFHTASPVTFESADPQTELIDPAVKGTLNVLRSCKKVASIRRVVITSSMASVMFNSNPLKPDVVVDENWFSDPVLCEQNKQWYSLSKTLAEQAAWKFAEENDIDLVTLHPGLVIGPFLQPDPNSTSQAFLNLLKTGKQLGSGGIHRFVDVRDVARAHILAFEESSASGRYCLVGRVIDPLHALKLCTESVATIEEAPYQVSKEKATSLGLDFTPFEVTIKDTIQFFKDNNFLGL